MSGKTSHDETATPRSCHSSGASAEPPHPRGRHRVSVPVSPALDRTLLGRGPMAVHEPTVPDASRSSVPPTVLRAFHR
jgi:hypothetical protein